VGQNKAGQSHLPIALAAGSWLILQLAHALVARETGASVSYGAHLGGFAMGLVLAFILGQLTAGRMETRQVRAREYFTEGSFHAAVGAWTEYLQFKPDDREGLLGRARALRMVGQPMQALRDYRKVMKAQLANREVDETLELYREIRRAELGRQLSSENLQRIAALLEKQLDYEGAVEAYRDLYEAYPSGSSGQRALVRLVHLYHGKLQEPKQAAYWLDLASRHLPGGSWREYLSREFNWAEETDAADPAIPGRPYPGTGL
jgi:tetratricopeptide (TPR) repeat protein